MIDLLLADDDLSTRTCGVPSHCFYRCSDAQLENMMKQADRSGSGSISLADFVRLMRKKGKGLVGCDEPDEDDITDAMAEALLPDPLSAARRQALMKVRLCGWW